MKLNLKRKELRALLKLLGDEEESDEPDRDETKDKKPTDEDDPFPISLGKKR